MKKIKASTYDKVTLLTVVLAVIIAFSIGYATASNFGLTSSGSVIMGAIIALHSIMLLVPVRTYCNAFCMDDRDLGEFVGWTAVVTVLTLMLVCFDCMLMLVGAKWYEML